MTSTEWHQDVRHIILRPTSNERKLDYSPGDIAVMYPINLFDIDKFCALMHYDPNMLFKLMPAAATITARGQLPPPPPLFPTPCTIRHALKYYLNILGVPTRRSVELLSFFCTNAEERDKLVEIGRRPDGADLYHSYLKREKRSFVELFEDFKSCKPPFEQLLSIIPFLIPREFSIASSPNAHDRDIHLAVAVVEFTSYYKRQRHGVCTQWLSLLVPGGSDIVPVRIKRGRVRPVPLNVPVIFVGPGTGIAPIMSLLHDRDVARRVSGGGGGCGGDGGSSDGNDGGAENMPVMQDLVFFGCRHRGMDYLFQSELERMCCGGEETTRNFPKLCVAFSRDSPPNKVYVQHLIGQNSLAVWNIIDPTQGNGRIVISGSSQKMPQDVMKVIQRIVVLHGKLSEKEANKFLKVMKNTGRCVIECW